MRVEVDRETCEGHGLCEQAAPQIYELDDDGYVGLRRQPDGSQEEGAAEAGARVCPVSALTIVR